MIRNDCGDAREYDDWPAAVPLLAAIDVIAACRTGDDVPVPRADGDSLPELLKPTCMYAREPECMSDGYDGEDAISP